MRALLISTLIITVCFCLPAGAQDSTAGPVCINARQLDDAPRVDGVLDDVSWQDCAHVSGFRETSRSRDPIQKTEVMVCCDRDHLYVAFICHDTQPSLISAVETRRNYSIASDDRVSVLIDTLHTHLSYYEFSVNAAGAQNESIPTGAASNITWRGDWRAAAKITGEGWCAEMSIPFRGLRYPSQCDTFGIAFKRYLPRADESSVWPDLGPNFDISRFADLSDLSLPSFGGRPVSMPYTVYSTESGDSFSRTGLDFKQELPNNVIAMMTYNPDFTDVQDAVTSIAYSYTERFRPDRRPFFQEGYDLFPDRTVFHSGRIGDIDVGAKSFGKVGRHTFAFLDALKRGEENHFAATYGYDPNPDAGFALYASGSTVKDAYKQDPADPDTSICLSPGAFLRRRSASGITSLSARTYLSMNSGRPNASAWDIKFARDAAAGHLGYELGYSSVDSDYFVRNAYVPLTGVRGVKARLEYHDRPSSSRLTYWDVFVTADRHWAQEGGLHHESVGVGASLNTRTEWNVGAYLSTGSWLGLRDSSAMIQVSWLSRHLFGGGSFGREIGKRAGQDYSYMWIDQSLKIGRKLVLGCGFEWTRFAGESESQYTLSGSYDFTPERNLGLWAVGRNSNINLCLTFKQTVRSGSDIYLICGYPNSLTTENRIALKIVRPMTW